MNVHDELVPLLKRLRLSGILQSLDLRIKQAVEDKLSFAEFLYRIVTDEVERRESKQLQKRLRRASFEQQKTLEDFNFSFNPQLPKEKILELATCQFVQRQGNIALIGPSGVGKSHIAQSLGQRACLAGFDVQYVIAGQMFKTLRAARADGSYERKLQRMCSVDLLVIDDLGLHPLKHDEPEDLYEVFRQRYEKGSLVITSNRAVAEWYPMFGNPLLASAALDRFLHHSEILILEGHSYRNPPKGAMQRTSTLIDSQSIDL